MIILKSGFTKKKQVLLGFATILLAWFYFSLPSQLFSDPYSLVLYSKEGDVLAAKVAADGQWRFKESDSLPDKFKQAIIHFEDAYFYYHPGINPVSLFRAMGQNIRAKRIVSGGSTITAQLMRMSRKNKKRTFWEKGIEFALALRLELKYSKEKILSLYSAHAPFGGNVVGLEAASWRYFGCAPHQLSWGESALLAVLPNAPSLIYPGKNHVVLEKKRDRLLDKLYHKEVIDSMTCVLAKAEPLPQKPKPLPQITPHLMTRMLNDGIRTKRVHTSINKVVQEKTAGVIRKYHHYFVENYIHNAAALVLEVKTGKVLAYVGNTKCRDENCGKDVDIISANRSTGSVLKPFLYALMLDEGKLLPRMILPDIPTFYSGYSPNNFDKQLDGAVPADEALARSLNIPAVRSLKNYGVERFHHKLKELNMRSIRFSAEHYGLSLILGGAEASLDKITCLYAGMADMLNRYSEEEQGLVVDHYVSSSYLLTSSEQERAKVFRPAALWWTFEALSNMDRPLEGDFWSYYHNSRKIAWKTGTSYGHRDAWAVGVTPEYVVGVWVGNADGEGRPGLTGTSAAAPVMFDVFKSLPPTTWFVPPYEAMRPVVCCEKSGCKASPYCTERDTILVPFEGLKSDMCPYHKQLFLDNEGHYQVNSRCYPVSDMQIVSWFVLPPVMEYYYKLKSADYRVQPKWSPDCVNLGEASMEIVYPVANARIFIPMDFHQQKQKLVVEVSHRQPQTTVYWHLDEAFIGETKQLHQIEISATEGEHIITVVDENGERLVRKFYLLAKD